MPTLCELIEDFQIHWGVRISEILKLEPEDLLPDDIVHVHASKFSNDRYIHDPEWIAAVRQYMILIPGQPIFDISYTQYWSWLKKRWEFYIPEGHENRRTTHMFRQDLIRNLYNEGWSIEEIAEFIGHKDPRSTQGYL